MYITFHLSSTDVQKIIKNTIKAEASKHGYQGTGEGDGNCQIRVIQEGKEFLLEELAIEIISHVTQSEE